jgi:hypothetical protein
MAGNAQETEVGKWLVANGAGQFADTFFEKGWENKTDLHDADIDEIVKAKTPGLAATLRRVLAAERAEEAKKKEPKKKELKAPLAIPALPPGTALDLSLETITSPDVPPFTLPSEVSMEASKDEVVSPMGLTDAQWMIVARNSGFLHGYTMENFKGGIPPKATQAVLDWMVPFTRDFVTPLFLNADVTADLTYTEETASYVKTGFDTEAASFGYAGCSASFERQHKERQAKTRTQKKLQIIGRSYYPRAELTLKECTRVSPRFIAEVQAAVKSPTPTKALQAVLADYGTAIPTRVTLGGELYMIHQKDVNGKVDESSEETTVKGAVSVKVGGAESTASTSVGSASSQRITEQSILERSQFTVQGGDVLLFTDAKKWPETLKNPNKWAVIRKSNMISTLELLDADLRKQAEDVWDRIPPMLLWMEDLPVESRSALVGSQAGFLMATRDANGEGPRGSVSLVCSQSDDPTLSDPGAVGSAACVHTYRAGDVWLDTNSICLPVPSGVSYHTSTADTWGTPGTRIAFMPTRLRFGGWEAAFPGGAGAALTANRDAHAASDGFLFVSIHADRSSRGVVRAKINGMSMAAASVHYYPPHENYISDGSFCLPVVSGSTYAVSLEPTEGAPAVSAWWLPITSPGWRLQAPVTRSVNTNEKAATDGILHAVLSFTQNGDRGLLKLYADADAPAQLSCATASIHSYRDRDRWIDINSAMLPVRLGSPYKAAFAPSYGAPNPQVFWTAIVPAR